MTASVRTRRGISSKSAFGKAISANHKPVSERKLAANRRNARNSTGPRTVAGKAISCKNAIRHGLTAELVLHHESREEFDRYRYAMLLALNPRDPAQLALADRIISCEWRLRRIGQAERHVLYQDPFMPDEEDFDFARDAIHLCQDAGGVLALSLNKGATLEKLSRYEQRLVNQSQRALRELKYLQAATGSPNVDDDSIESDDHAAGVPCPYVPQWFVDESIRNEDQPLEESAAHGPWPQSGSASYESKMQNEPTAVPLGASQALTNSYTPREPGRNLWRPPVALAEDDPEGQSSAADPWESRPPGT